MTDHVPSRTPTETDALAEQHLDAVAVLDPVSATYMGLPGHDDALTDYSPTGHGVRAARSRATLDRLAGIRPVDDTDRVTAAALRERLGLGLEFHAAGLDLADLNNISSPVQSLREVFDIAPTATVADWEAIGTRLEGIGAALAGYRESLVEARRRGWVPPARQVLAAARQCADAGAPDGFFTSLHATAATSDGDPLPSRLPDRLAAAGNAAARAYLDQERWLRRELLPTARTDDAVGRDLYPLYARAFLGSTVDVEDTYAWGLAELAHVERRMAEVARRIVPDGTATGDAIVAEAIAVLDADPGRRIEGAEAFRDWMQDLADTAIADLDGTHFDIPAPLHTLRCRIAPSSSGAIYYTGPSEDLSRPGQMWWSVPDGVTRFSAWQERTTVYHEGVPGHHLQIGRAVLGADRLNRWRRLASWVSGHGEGWALYAERLMEELGYLTDPGDLMGMLDAQALRAARVVVDIGVHCRLAAPAEVGGGVWDPAKAWAFLRRHTRVPDPSLRFELDRYLGWPGQAISYKVGERVWLDLRAQVKARDGAGFDLRAFHRDCLALGSVGLDVLAGAVLGTLPDAR
ncbi:MAG: DUF885 domain-containing protein [Kineosporiaceae bacterium]